MTLQEGPTGWYQMGQGFPSQSLAIIKAVTSNKPKKLPASTKEQQMSLIDTMVERVQAGKGSRSVWETSLQYGLGSSVKVNKPTTATEQESGSSISLPAETVVTIVGVGGGPTGVDHVAQLADGRVAVIPYADLGEAVHPDNDDDDDEKKKKEKEKKKEEALLGRNEDIVGVVAKVVLSKPLPQSVIDWLAGGYTDYGVELPMTPESDATSAVTFLMKSEDQEMLDAGIEALKRVAGATFKSSSSSDLISWNKALGNSVLGEAVHPDNDDDDSDDNDKDDKDKKNGGKPKKGVVPPQFAKKKNGDKKDDKDEGEHDKDKKKNGDKPPFFAKKDKEKEKEKDEHIAAMEAILANK